MPTFRGWAVLIAAALLLLAAILLDRREGLYFAGFLVLLSLGSHVYARTHRPKLRARRSFVPSTVSAGEESVVRARIDGQGGTSTSGSWVDQASAVFDRMPAGDLPPSLPGGRGYRAIIEYRLRSIVRGRYEIGPLWVTHTDPFGLVVAERAIAGTETLIVTPRVTALLDSRLLSASGDGTRHELSHYSNPRSDELIAREYRPGDPLRRVNWRQTARRGELMVRQEEQQGDPEAVLVLDTALGEKGTTVGASSVMHFERMIELAASIGVHLLESGYSVTLVETASGVEGPLGAGEARSFHFVPGGDAALLTTLADTQRWSVDDGYEVTSGFASIIRQNGKTMPVFAVLGQVSSMNVRRLSAIKVNAEPAVAFVSRGGAEHDEELHLLAESGWRIALLGEHTPVASAWTAVALGEPEKVAAPQRVSGVQRGVR